MSRGDSGGEAASLREAPLPQTPSPEERLAFEGAASTELVPPESWARFPVSWLRSRRLTEPPRPARGWMKWCKIRQSRTVLQPFCSACFELESELHDWEGFQRLPPQRELSAARLAGPPTPHGRGGSVSRRDLDPPAENRTQLSWARTSEGKDKPIPSHSSGERGLGGEAPLLEKRPLPPAFPHPSSLEKGARGRGLFFRKGLSLAPLTIKELL